MVGAHLESVLNPLSLALGRAHGCVAAPVVSCWGANDKGQVGTGAAVASTPQVVPFAGAPLEATAVAAGDAFSCAIAPNKRAICWGDNTTGAVTDGAKGAMTPPTGAFTGIDVVAVAAGTGVSCIVDVAGVALCRGAGDQGQLGRGSVVTDGSAGAVSGLTNVVAVAVGGAHACAIAGPTSLRKVYCWGRNADGQVDPTRTDKAAVLAPVVVSFPSPTP